MEAERILNRLGVEIIALATVAGIAVMNYSAAPQIHLDFHTSKYIEGKQTNFCRL